MAVSSRYFVLEFDPDTKKCRLVGENWVRFRGQKDKDTVKRRVEERKRKDEENPPAPAPAPAPTPAPAPSDDRDGYIYCDFNGTKTYHYVTTSPPYTDTDLGGPDCTQD